MSVIIPFYFYLPDKFDASHGFSGKTNAWACSFFLHVGLYGTAIAYTVTSAISMRYAVDIAICYGLKKSRILYCLSFLNFQKFFSIPLMGTGQFRNQTVTTEKGTRQHVNTLILTIC